MMMFIEQSKQSTAEKAKKQRRNGRDDIGVVISKSPEVVGQALADFCATLPVSFSLASVV